MISELLMRQMPIQQRHLTQIQILTLIQNQKLHLRSSSPFPGKLLLCENSCVERNGTSRKNSHGTYGASFSSRHQTQISCLFEILTHASLAHSSCSNDGICLRNDCVNSWTYFQLPREDNRQSNDLVSCICSNSFPWQMTFLSN